MHHLPHRLANPRLDGPARHLRIHPPLPAWEIAVCCAVAALIGAMLAIGGL